MLGTKNAAIRKAASKDENMRPKVLKNPCMVIYATYVWTRARSQKRSTEYICPATYEEMESEEATS